MHQCITAHITSSENTRHVFTRIPLAWYEIPWALWFRLHNPQLLHDYHLAHSTHDHSIITCTQNPIIQALTPLLNTLIKTTWPVRQILSRNLQLIATGIFFRVTRSQAAGAPKISPECELLEIAVQNFYGWRMPFMILQQLDQKLHEMSKSKKQQEIIQINNMEK